MTTLSYERGAGDAPLLDITIGEQLRRAVARFPEREALVVRHQHVRLTYAQLWQEVDTAARALMARGVRKGDRVGIWSANRYEWVLTQFATARIGAILVTLNPAYEAEELRYALDKAGVSLLVDQAFLDAGWDEFLAGGTQITDEQLAERERSLHPGDAINIQFTSGTTGSPKGATLSHRNILNNAYFSARTLRYDERDRVCVPVPFYHCFGMVLGTLACVTHGACLVVPSQTFDPAAVLETIEGERCTSLYGVPMMFIAALERPDFERFDLTSLRTGIMGGAPCPAELMKQVRGRLGMREVTIACGMTETSPVSTQTTVDDPVHKRVTTVGGVHPHVEVKIVDPATGTTVPRGIAGEQCTRGYGVMLGYWDDQQATAEAVDAEGWMHTGDLAAMDDEGYVSIVGRIKDMIIRGGENIAPREVEDFLRAIDGVLDAQVFGVPSERYGEEVAAWVKLQDGATLTEDDLMAACRGRIARHKIPRHWKLVDGFPMTVTGKPQKYVMRERAARELVRA